MNKNTVERIATLREALRKNAEAMAANPTPAKFEELDCERVQLERELAATEAQRGSERVTEGHQAEYKKMEAELARLTGEEHAAGKKLDETMKAVGDDIGKYFKLGRRAAYAELATNASEPVIEARVAWSGANYRRQVWRQKMREFRTAHGLDGGTPRPGEPRKERRSGPVDHPTN